MPSFPVLEVKFTHVKYAKDDSMTSYDGFIRETSELVKVNTMISVCSGCKNSFFIPIDEFMRSNVQLELNTFDNKVFVVWNWNILLPDISPSMSTTNSTAAAADVDHQGIDDVNDQEGVVFKCIGSAKEEQYQKHLAEVNRLRSQGIPIEVRVLHEASNRYDSRAIAVQVFLDSKWNRIGYLVREVLESVHRAMHEDKIVSVKLDWTKFLLHWRSPGWYCGIKIIKRGRWGDIVHKFQSKKM